MVMVMVVITITWQWWLCFFHITIFTAKFLQEKHPTSCLDPRRLVEFRIASATFVSFAGNQWLLQFIKTPDVRAVIFTTRFFPMSFAWTIRFIYAKVTLQTKFVSHSFKARMSWLDTLYHFIKIQQYHFCNISPLNCLGWITTMDWKERNKENIETVNSNVGCSISITESSSAVWEQYGKFCWQGIEFESPEILSGALYILTELRRCGRCMGSLATRATVRIIYMMLGPVVRSLDSLSCG